MRTRLIVAATCAGLAAGTACSASGPGTGAARPEQASVTVAVRNDNFYGANIHALYEGLVRRRVGWVEGFTTDTFTIPWRPSRLQMEMGLVGVGTTYSNVLSVEPGDVLELVLLPDMHHKVIRGR